MGIVLTTPTMKKIKAVIGTIHRRLKKFLARLSGKFTLEGSFHGILRNEENGEILHEVRVDNLVTTVAKSEFVKLLNNESATVNITHLAVGTGANNPAVSDTTLQTELARTTIVGSSNVRTNNALTMEFFFPTTEANGAIKEIGVFLDGTGTADTGTLFDRALFDVTKTNQNSLTVVFDVTCT